MVLPVGGGAGGGPFTDRRDAAPSEPRAGGAACAALRSSICPRSHGCAGPRARRALLPLPLG